MLYKKSKTIKSEILSRCACTAFTSAWFLETFEKSEIQTYRYTLRQIHIHKYTNWLLYAFSACSPRHNHLITYSLTCNHILTHLLTHFLFLTPQDGILPLYLSEIYQNPTEAHRLHVRHFHSVYCVFPNSFSSLLQYMFATLGDVVPMVMWSRHLESPEDLLKQFEDSVYHLLQEVSTQECD